MRVTGQSPLPPHDCGLHFHLLTTLWFRLLAVRDPTCHVLPSDPKEAVPVFALLSPRNLLNPSLVINPELCLPCSKAAASGLCRLLSPQGAPVCAFLEF